MYKDKGVIAKLSANMYFDDAWKGVVVLANPKTVLCDKKAPEEIRKQVIKADQLVAFIRKNEASSKQPTCSEKEMKEAAESWLARNKQNPVDYTERFREMATKESTEPIVETDPAEELICQKCGAPLVKRKATKGAHAGEEFWGCSNYPKCRNIIPMKK